MQTDLSDLEKTKKELHSSYSTIERLTNELEQIKDIAVSAFSIKNLVIAFFSSFFFCLLHLIH